jgi:hypothetical protein
MKKLFILTVIIATSFIATKGYAQVFVGARIGPAHIGVGLPVVRHPYFAPAPVVYGGAYVGPAYAPAPALYYEHYRPVFMRSHPYYHRGRW